MLSRQPLKRVISPVKEEEVEQNSSIISSPANNKFQRTNKRGINTPQETNATSQKSESILTPEAINNQPTERSKLLSRTNRLADKKQQVKLQEPAILRQGAKIQTMPNQIQQSTSPNYFRKAPVQRFAETSPPPNIIQKIQPQPPKALLAQSKSASQLLTNKNTASRVQMATTESKLASKFQKIEQPSKLIQPIKLKKTATVGFIINKLFRKNIYQSLIKLKQHKNQQKIKNMIEVKVLILQMSEFANRFIAICQRDAFTKLKLITNKKSKQNHQIDHQIFKVNSVKIKQSISTLINILYRIKFKDSVQTLRNNYICKKRADKAAPVLLDFYEKRKIKQAFHLFKEKSLIMNSRKQDLLSQISQAYTFCSKVHQFMVFKKILLFSNSVDKNKEENVKIQNPAPSSPRNIPSSPKIIPKTIDNSSKIDKMIMQQQKLNQQINSIQQKNQQKKRETQNQSKKLKKKVQQLQISKNKFETQVNIRKNLNSQLKTQIQNNRKPNQQLQVDDVEGRGLSQLRLLQQIYSQINKLSDQDLTSNLERLRRDYKIEQGKNNTLVRQWDLLINRAKLQRQIDHFQNKILGPKISESSNQNNFFKMMREQNDMVSSMIRNYIKERYLWSEVERFVASVI